MITEISKHPGVPFYIYSTDDFLRRVAELLGTSVSTEVVQDVKRVQEEIASTFSIDEALIQSMLLRVCSLRTDAQALVARLIAKSTQLRLELLDAISKTQEAYHEGDAAAQARHRSEIELKSRLFERLQDRISKVSAIAQQTLQYEENLSKPPIHRREYANMQIWVKIRERELRRLNVYPTP